MSQLTAREQWYISHRLYRIARREALKSVRDMVIFGSGFVHVNPNGEAKHIPFSETRAITQEAWDGIDV